MTNPTNPDVPKQPYYVLNDEVYNRMMGELRSGERYANRRCDSNFFLDGGVIKRVVNGERKRVVPLSLVSELDRLHCVLKYGGRS